MESAFGGVKALHRGHLADSWFRFATGNTEAVGATKRLSHGGEGMYLVAER